MEKRIGLISGNGEFPLLFIRNAAEQGFSVCVCAFKGEALPEIEIYAHEIIWIHVGQIKKIIKFFKKQNITRAVMLGGVKKTRLFLDVRPDTMAIKALAKLKNTHDDNILRTFAQIMENNGIEIAASYEFMPDLLAEKGIWTNEAPSIEIMKDIVIGYRAAKKIGELDIGQTVVVSGGSIVAVEAVEGTDSAIKRGGELSGKDGVVVKVSKPFQDMRFDIPAVGPDTIRTMQKSGMKALALEASKTNVLDRKQMIELADKYKIIIAAVNEDFFRENGFE